ncbi:hypothetical protein ACGFI9_03075 [Micromonospora sp. NPDC048930]|uniref:hypothetical protein n=1 Tax=Micromonospora sp. NPDC048930 TaxID=3364261 RepID=UPI003717B56B
MRSTRLGLVSPVMLALVVMAGCDDGGGAPAADRTPSGGAAAATAQPSATGATMSDATKTACTTISKDIDAALAKVATAEKIGPPAGHLAVSAQFSAGAAGLYAHTFTDSTAVNDAAKQVATAMSDLADAYAKDPKAKPGRAALDGAVTQLKTACAAG